MSVDLGLLQLSDEEAKVYQILLVSGQLTRAEIKISTHLANETLTEILSILQERNLIRSVPGMIDKYAALLPLGSTKDELVDAASQVDILGTELEQTSLEEMTQLQADLDQAANELAQKVQSNQESLQQQVAELKQSTDQNKTQLDQSRQSTITEQQSAATTNLEETKSRILPKITAFKESGINRVQSKEDQITKESDEAKARQNSVKTTAVEQMVDLDLSPVSSIEQESTVKIGEIISTGQTNLSQIKNQQDQQIEAIDSSFRSKTSTITDAGEAYKGKSAELLNQTKAELNEKVVAENTKLAGFVSDIASQTAQLNDLIDSNKTADTTTINQAKSQLEELKSNLAGVLDQVNTSIGSSTDEIKTKMDGLVATSDQQLSAEVASSHTSLESMATNLTSQLQERMETELNEFLAATKQRLNADLSSFVSELEEKKNQLDTQRGQTISSLQSAIGATTAEAKTQLNSSINLQKEELASNLSSSQGRLEQLTTEHGQRLSEFGQAAQTQTGSMKASIEETTMDFQNWSEAVGLRIDQHITQQQQAFEQILQTAATEMQTQLDTVKSELVAANTTQHDALVADLQQMLTSTNQQLNTALQEVSNSLQVLHTNQQDRVRSVLNQIEQDYNQLVDQNRSANLDTITQLKQDTEVIAEDITGSITSLTATINTKFGELFSDIAESLQRYTEETHQSVTSRVDQVQQIGTQTLDHVKQLSSSGTEGQLDAVQRTFDRYNEKYNQTAGKVSEKAHALANVLDGLFKLQQDTEIPTLKSTNVVGQDSIIQYMSEMIGRMKSKMTILAPKPSMIDVDKILALPMTAQVTIVSSIDEVTQRDWVEKLHGAKANVTLRTLTDQGFGAKLPDFIGCEREGEEIIIGTVDEGNNDYVAIASASENFVKIFGSQIISEYSRGRSKQLQK